MSFVLLVCCSIPGTLGGVEVPVCFETVLGAANGSADEVDGPVDSAGDDLNFWDFCNDLWGPPFWFCAFCGGAFRESWGTLNLSPFEAADDTDGLVDSDMEDLDFWGFWGHIVSGNIMGPRLDVPTVPALELEFRELSFT